MATSKPSSKSSFNVAAQSPDYPHGPLGRRTARSSVLNSPEHHLQAPQRKLLVRSGSDASKINKSPIQQQQPSAGTSAAKRQPIRKTLEKSLSLQGTATQTVVKERAPRTSPATVTRPTIAAKQSVDKAPVSKVGTKTARTQAAVSKARNVVGLTKKKEAITTTTNKNEKYTDIGSEYKNKEISSEIEDQNSPIKDDCLPSEQLDDIPELKVAEYADDIFCEHSELNSTEINHHADSFLYRIDDEPIPLDESGENEENFNKKLLDNVDEATSAKTTEEYEMEPRQNSKAVGRAENKNELVQLYSEIREIRELDKELVNTVNIESAIANRSEVVQGMRTETPKSNEVIEETRNKLLLHRKSKVKALVGAFETVMS